jgi:fumarate reductase subunit D
MSTLIQPMFIIVLFVAVRSIDIAISAGVARDAARAICYGIVAILAVVATIIALGLHS